MVLGIADICMYEHLRAGRLNKVEFVRKAADLGAETVSIGLPTESEGQELRLVADEVGIELEFRVGRYGPRGTFRRYPSRSSSRSVISAYFGKRPLRLQERRETEADA